MTQTSPAGSRPATGAKRRKAKHSTTQRPASKLLDIGIERDGSTTVLRLVGELDMATADELRRHILLVLDQHDPHRILLDLSELSFTDSSGLAAMVWAHQQLASRGRQLRLHHPQAMVRRVLHITGLHTRLHITETPQPPRRSGTGAGSPGIGTGTPGIGSPGAAAHTGPRRRSSPRR